MDNVNEEMLTTKQVAEILNSSEQTVLSRFGSYPGVIDISEPTVTRRGKRPYHVLRIPRHVFNRNLHDHKV